MKPLIVLIGLLLAGCSQSSGFGKGVPLTTADAAITQPCRRPVAIPDRAITQAEAERYWRVDRASLVRCGAEKREVVRYYENLFKRINKKS